MRTTVGIIGAGPAGLLLSHLLHRQGVDNVVVESRSREYVSRRQRAGILEQGTVDILRATGASDRMDREGLPHEGIELRFDRARHRIDFPSLTGGRAVMVYAQTEVVKDLIALREAAGDTVLFEAEVTAITGTDAGDRGGRPQIHYRQQGVEQVLDCDLVVACDGFHGIGRRTVPAEALHTTERSYPFAWLGILADVPPSCEELVYAHHERGFALHSMRSPQVSRLYLQVDPDDSNDNWSDERIWDELDVRFATDDGWTLRRGPITEKSITPMRSFVAEPMRHGRLFLAGDAAHIVPPTGAKGLNLAVADVTLLATALTRWRHQGDESLLDGYSETALRRVWRAEHFSWTMTTLLHSDPGEDEFDRRLRLSHLRYLTSSAAGATTVAENYVGLPFE
jgi:p-hydroxybenzoate 3-monooxygenase